MMHEKNDTRIQDGGGNEEPPILETDEVDSGDDYLDVPWLTDNEDEEWQNARKKSKAFEKQGLYAKFNEVSESDSNKDDLEANTNSNLHPITNTNNVTVVDPNETFDGVESSGSFASDDDFSIATTSDDSEPEEARRRRSRYRVFDESKPIPEFALGMIFLNRKQFKDAVLADSLYVRREVVLKKNDKERVRAVCADTMCKWKMLLSVDSRTRCWMVKTYHEVHSCPLTYSNRRARSPIIARHFLKSRGFSALTLNLVDIKDITKEELHLEITLNQARNTKIMITKEFQGNYKKEYSKLWDYRKEILKTNPTTRVELDARRPTPNANPVFLRFYVCFAALREGFLAGCRPVLGLDGAFLKGPCKGQLLTAVARDANNQIYPVTWGVVETESRDTWGWFLDSLSVDLKIGDGNKFTFVSDQQKGLIQAIKEMFPQAEHRRCARHIYANWRKAHRGKELHKWFWICAKSTTDAQFKKNLKEIEKNKTCS